MASPERPSSSPAASLRTRICRKTGRLRRPAPYQLDHLPVLPLLYEPGYVARWADSWRWHGQHYNRLPIPQLLYGLGYDVRLTSSNIHGLTRTTLFQSCRFSTNQDMSQDGPTRDRRWPRPCAANGPSAGAAPPTRLLGSSSLRNRVRPSCGGPALPLLRAPSYVPNPSGPDVDPPWSPCPRCGSPLSYFSTTSVAQPDFARLHHPTSQPILQTAAPLRTPSVCWGPLRAFNGWLLPSRLIPHAAQRPGHGGSTSTLYTDRLPSRARLRPHPRHYSQSRPSPAQADSDH